MAIHQPGTRYVGTRWVREGGGYHLRRYAGPLPLPLAPVRIPTSPRPALDWWQLTLLTLAPLFGVGLVAYAVALLR